MKDFLLSCSTWTRLRHGAGSVGWPGTKPLHHAKSFQRLGRALNVLSWALLPCPPPAVLKWTPSCACLCASHVPQLLLRSVNLVRTSGQQWSHFISFPSASWGTEKQMARQSTQLIYGEIVFSSGRFCLLAVRKGNTIICFCQHF